MSKTGGGKKIGSLGGHPGLTDHPTRVSKVRRDEEARSALRARGLEVNVGPWDGSDVKQLYALRSSVTTAELAIILQRLPSQIHNKLSEDAKRERRARGACA